MHFDTQPNVNRNHKDRLFRLVFGNEEYIENSLALYNALNGTNYTDTSLITVTTIDDFLYMGMKNDVSLMICGDLPVWEQQSSYNPNMPLRGFIYYGMLYKGLIGADPNSIYGRDLIKIPTPQYVVFYNGTEKRPPIEEMRLSDAFMNPDTSGRFEWTAKVININPGCNDDLVSSCKPLHDYMFFINSIREFRKTDKDLRVAIHKAIKHCIASGIMVELLQRHEAEVTDVLFTEFDQESFIDYTKKKSFEDGVRQGMELGMERGIERGIERGLERGREQSVHDIILRCIKAGKSPEEIVDITGCDIETIKKIIQEKG